MSAGEGRLGRYELIGTLGNGSFATVYRAWDPLLDREVGLKALLPHLASVAEDRLRFLAEARALAGIKHPNIVTVYDVGEAGGRPFFAMELIEGRTLAELVTAGRVPVERTLDILNALAPAIDRLHEAGLVHRDIKDANVMVTPVGRVVLMDLGIALATGGPRLTEPGGGMGTPESAAPEQIRGEDVGPAADIYALGVLAYELFAGRLPFTGDATHVLYAQAALPPPPLRDLRPGLPESVYLAIDAALAKSPGERPASAAAFLEMLTKDSAAGAAECQPKPALSTSPIHIEAAAGMTVPVRLSRGFTTFRFRCSPQAQSRLRASVLDVSGAQLTQLVQANGTYYGTTTFTLAADGAYVVAVEANNPWELEIEQPDVAAQAGVKTAAGSGDSIAYLALLQGVRRLLVSHQVWDGTLFRLTLLNSRGEQPDRLVATTGPYRGTVSRRIPDSGTYVLVIEAEGTWTVTVK